MNKKKLILSILLLVTLLAVCIIIPLIHKRGGASDHNSSSETSKATAQQESESDTEVVLLELDFQKFEELNTHLSEDQIESLKKQMTYYISVSDPSIDTVSFIPEEITYLSAYKMKLLFQLSNGNELPVYHDLKTDTFTFTDDETVIETKEEVIYEKEVDYSLPNYSAEQVETMQEGGYPDVDTPIETKEVQP